MSEVEKQKKTQRTRDREAQRLDVVEWLAMLTGRFSDGALLWLLWLRKRDRKPPLGPPRSWLTMLAASLVCCTSFREFGSMCDCGK